MREQNFPRGPARDIPGRMMAHHKGGLTFAPPCVVDGVRTSALWCGEGRVVEWRSQPNESGRLRVVDGLAPDDLKPGELRDALKLAGVDVPRGAKKADLIALLEAL